MEKTEMMKRFEEETGGRSTGGFTDGFHCVGIEVWHFEYIAWLEAKAEAYDRLMSGGKKTLKEWANFLGTNIAINNNGDGVVSVNPLEFITLSDGYKIAGYWSVRPGYPYTIFNIPSYLIAYSGDWKDTLTLPDGWEEK